MIFTCSWFWSNSAQFRIFSNSKKKFQRLLFSRVSLSLPFLSEVQNALGMVSVGKKVCRWFPEWVDENWRCPNIYIGNYRRLTPCCCWTECSNQGCRIFKQKIPNWVNLGRPCNGRYWFILRPFGIHICLLVDISPRLGTYVVPRKIWQPWL
jgi:hypothetical protein